MTDGGFKIHERGVARYFYWFWTLFFVFVFGWLFGAGLVLGIIYAIFIGPWLSRKQAKSLTYWLDGNHLCVDQGVYFLKRKAIPLDRVTDLVLAQGPLLRYCGIWALQVQTSGSGGQAVPEATLYGLRDPEGARDTVLEARDHMRSSQA